MTTVERIDAIEIYRTPGEPTRVHMVGRLSNGKPWDFTGEYSNAHTRALMERYYREHEHREDDRPRAETKEHRVRGHGRDVDGRTERVRSHLAKNPRRRR